MKRAMIAIAFWSMAGFVAADDITDAIDQAVALYNNGQTRQAISQLEFAAEMIRQARAAQLVGFLPEPLDGWTAGEPQSQTAGAALFGGGTNVSRSYRKGTQNVEISIITDSPLMQQMMMVLSNPAILAAQGGQLQMIQGQQAVLKADGLTMVLNSTYLVQLNGSAGGADFVAYANAIDIPGLLAF